MLNQASLGALDSLIGNDGNYFLEPVAPLQIPPAALAHSPNSFFSPPAAAQLGHRPHSLVIGPMNDDPFEPTIAEIVNAHTTLRNKLATANYPDINTTARTNLFTNVRSIARLTSKAGMSLDDLLALPGSHRSILINTSLGVTQLVREVDIPLKFLLDLDLRQQWVLCSASRGVTQLIHEARIPLHYLLERTEQEQSFLFNQAHGVTQLMRKIGITPDVLCKLDSQKRSRLCSASHAVTQLVCEAGIPLAYLLGLTGPRQSLFFKQSGTVTRLIREAGIITPADLVECTEVQQSLLFSRSHAVTQLVHEAHIPGNDLLALTAQKLRILVDQAGEVVRAINNNEVTSQALLAMEASQLSAALAGGNHPAAVTAIGPEVKQFSRAPVV